MSRQLIRRRGLWLVVVAFLSLNIAGCGSSLADDAIVTGLTVIDGDTIGFSGRVIELQGIDAPELGQWCLDGEMLYACGRAAAFELQKILTLESVTCRQQPTVDEYQCRTGEGLLSIRLLEDGQAVATAGSELEPYEETARHVPLGIWRGKFIQPWDWRQGKRLPEEQAAGERCPVLGVDRAGTPVYVVPTDPDYEAWSERKDSIRQRFCSDEAARAAGYGRAAVASKG